MSCTSCNQENCGCGDNGLTIDNLCNPTPCDTPQCEESTAAECAIYGGVPIIYNNITFAETGDTVIDIIDNVINYMNSNVIYNIAFSLTAAQVKTLYSIPIEVIPAPGVGYAIEVITASSRLNYGSVAFNSAGTALILQTDTAAYPQTASDTILNNTSNVFSKHLHKTSDTVQLVENKALMISIATADSTLGDSTIDTYISYRIITL